MQRKKLNSKAGSEVEMPRKWELREIEGAETIHISWSFTNPRDIPFDLEEKIWNPEKYSTARLQEVLQKGGGIDSQQVMAQRPGIMDTGKHVAEIKYCQGGITLIAQLLSQQWRITDAWWELRESEQSKVLEKNHKKARVHLILRKGEQKKLSETALKGIQRLARKTWICHIWDNRHININKTVTVNFTFMQEDTPPDTEVVLPTPP